MKQTAVCIMALICITAWPALAEENEKEIVKLPDLEVTEDRQGSAEISLKEIDIKSESKSGIATVPDTLDKVSGLDIQRRSIMTPKSSQVSIRGMDERRSLIMLDGRPLNGTGVMGGHFVDWSVLSLQTFEKIDLGKGAFSAKYGNTLGGTVNMVPVDPGPEPVIKASMAMKSYETYSAGASASGGLGNLISLVSGSYQTTDGYLRNSEAERKDFSGRFSYAFGENGKIFSGIRYTDGDFNMPVENQPGSTGYDASYPSCVGSYLAGPGIQFPTGDAFGDNSYYTKERAEVDFGLTTEVAGFGSEVKVYFNNEDREDTFYSMNNGDIVLKREAVPDRSWGWVAKSEKAFSEHKLGFGLDGNYQGYKGTDLLYVKSGYFTKAPSEGADDLDATRVHGLYLDDSWAIFKGVELYAGLRYEDYFGDRTVNRVASYTAAGKIAGWETAEAKFDEQVLLPKLGLTYRPAKEWSFHGRAARATRFPDNPAFYWYYGGYRPEVDPNSDVVRKDLTYEDALQFEAGITYTGIPDGKIKVTGYQYRVKDYIRWIFGYTPSRVVYNIDEVNFRGVEVDVDKQLFDNISAFANFTWQQTEKEGDVLDGSNALSDEISELPEFKANFGLTHTMVSGLETRATVRWVDDRQVPYLSSGSAEDGTPVGKDVTLKTLKNFFVVDLSFKFPFKIGKTSTILSAGVENLFDEYYEEEYGFPNTDRTFYAGIEFTY